MTKPLVSVIFACYNEEKFIERLLSSLKKQSYKNIEVIVVDDGSTDQSVRVAKKYTKNVFARGHAERSIQRNFGVRQAKGEHILILDADMKLSPRVISECIETVSKDKAIGGVMIPEKSIASNFWENVKAFERSFYTKEGDLEIEAARFFPRSVFLNVGGYDETLTGPEDWDLSETVKKRGYKIARIKSVIYHYERIPSLFSLLKKKYQYALTAHRYAKKQRLSLISPKSIHFLRPEFYQNWQRLLEHPFLSLSMFFIFFLQILAGVSGFIIGKIKNV